MTHTQKLSQACSHLRKHDPVIRSLIEKFGPCNLRPHTDYYGELLSSIVSQQLSVKAAETIWKRLLKVFDNNTPTPEELITIPNDTLRACGISYAKISYMKDLGQHIIDGQLDLEHLNNLPNRQILDQLVSVKGIGEWSAHMFMIFSLGRLDVLPVGDLGIKKAIKSQYNFKELPSAIEISDLAQSNYWNPYESVACWYLWKSTDSTST